MAEQDVSLERDVQAELLAEPALGARYAHDEEWIQQGLSGCQDESSSRSTLEHAWRPVHFHRKTSSK